MDLMYFLDNHVHEPIPNHSTICKTQKRILQEIFSEVFDQDLPEEYTIDEMKDRLA